MNLSSKRKISASTSAWIILIFLSIIWGSSFILIKKSLIAFSGLEVGAMRIAIATIAFLPFTIFYFKKVPWSQLKYFIIVGLTGSGIPAFLYAIAQTKVDSGVAGLLNSLTPIFALIIGLIFFGARLIGKEITGISLGFLGASILIWLDHGQQSESNLFYVLLIVLATMCYGTSVNVVKHKLSGLKPMMISCVSFILTGPLAIAYLFTTDILKDIELHPEGLNSLYALLALSLLSTFLATIVFYKLVQQSSAVFAASVSFLIPIVALGWAFLDGEKLGIPHIASLILILLGVYLIKRAKT